MGLMKVVSRVIIWAMFLSLSGCGGGAIIDIENIGSTATSNIAATTTTTTTTTTLTTATPANATNSSTGGIGQSVNIGLFTASYYNGTAFVASELVARPSINYALASFKGIDSLNFNATWVGSITVTADTTIDINFDVSWSDVSLFIDGVEIAAWANTSQTFSPLFTAGVHEVKIVYANHWNSTAFNVSFSTNTTDTIASVTPLITPFDPATQVIYVGAYESGDTYNNTTVVLNTTNAKVFLFLTSYRSMNWIIQNPNNVTIAGIVYSSFSNVSTVTADPTVAQYEVSSLSYGYIDFTAPNADITTMIGRSSDFSCGAYSLSQATVSIPTPTC